MPHIFGKAHKYIAYKIKYILCKYINALKGLSVSLSARKLVDWWFELFD